jgi:hypothetical protein
MHYVTCSDDNSDGEESETEEGETEEETSDESSSDDHDPVNRYQIGKNS